MESDELLKVDKVESFIYFPPFRWPEEDTIFYSCVHL